MDLKQFKELKINGQQMASLSIGGVVIWSKGVGPVEDWKLDEDGYLIGADGKYYERWYDDSHIVDNNPIADLNNQWVEDTVSGDLNIDKDFDYFMSNSNYNVSSSYSQFKVSWSGLTHIDFLYRSYGESNFDYLVINGLDKDKFTSQPSYSTSGILAHTYGKAATTYNTLSIDCDEGEHFIWFCYRKDGSGNVNSDRAFVGIPNNYKEGEIFEKQGEELHYEYVKSSDFIIPREGYIQFKYYKTYFSPNGLNSFTTDEYVLGEEVPVTPITKNYLRFDATTNDVHIGFNDLNLITNMEYSDSYEETFLPFPSEGVDIKQGKSIWLKASGASTSSSSRTFTTNNMVECHGDVRSLLSKTNFETTNLTNNCFRGLFSNTSLTTAPELPSTTLANNCYQNMFSGCTSLTTAPELPSTTLANYCYYYMFSGCTSLTTVTELPATTIKDWAYANMFSGCTSLTTTPELPATTLANNCYQNMFYGCTSLTTVTELPASNVLKGSYAGMFDGCTSLTIIGNIMPNLESVGVSACGGYTESSNYGYGMFRNCKNLTTVHPKLLSATTLANRCYHGMFEGCESLTTPPELPSTTLSTYCYHNMFKDCKSLTTAPELPATDITDYAYSYMFYGCTSLTTAPELPATRISGYYGGYEHMFDGCVKLSTIKCKAMRYSSGQTMTAYIAVDWLNNVSSTGVFYKNPEWDGPTSRGPHTIPSGWTIVDWTDAA